MGSVRPTRIEWGMRLRILYFMELKSCNNGALSVHIYVLECSRTNLPHHRILCSSDAFTAATRTTTIMLAVRHYDALSNQFTWNAITNTHIHPSTHTLPYGGSSTSKQWQHVNESLSELNWLRGWTGVLWGMTVGVKWSGVGVEGTLCHQYVPAAYTESLSHSQESASSYKWRMIIVALHLKTRTTTLVVAVEWELGFLCLFNDDKKNQSVWGTIKETIKRFMCSNPRSNVWE